MVNTELRNSEDIRDGVGRVTDEDWDAKAAASDPDDIWVLIMCVMSSSCNEWSNRVLT